jgi:hypothetical protein
MLLVLPPYRSEGDARTVIDLSDRLRSTSPQTIREAGSSPDTTAPISGPAVAQGYPRQGLDPRRVVVPTDPLTEGLGGGPEDPEAIAALRRVDGRIVVDLVRFPGSADYLDDPRYIGISW